MSYEKLNVGQRLWVYFKLEWLPIRIVDLKKDNGSHEIIAITISDSSQTRKISFDFSSNIVVNSFFTGIALELLGFKKIDDTSWELKSTDTKSILCRLSHKNSFSSNSKIISIPDGCNEFEWLKSVIEDKLNLSETIWDKAFLSCERDLHPLD